MLEKMETASLVKLAQALNEIAEDLDFSGKEGLAELALLRQIEKELVKRGVS